MDWVEQEKQTFQIRREIRRLLFRASPHRRAIVLLSLLGATALIGYWQYRPRQYRARAIIRIQENMHTRAQTQLPTGDLRNYIYHRTLSLSQLESLVKRDAAFSEYAKQTPSSELAAEIRDAIRVKVYKNFFLLSMGYSTAERSARVVLEAHSSDVDYVSAVVSSLAKHIEQSERTRLLDKLEKQAALFEQGFQQLRTKTENVEKERSALNQEIRNARTHQDRAPLLEKQRQLEKRYENLRARLRKASNEATLLERQLSMEKQQLGLSFEIVDLQLPRTHVLSLRTAGVVWLALVYLCLPFFTAFLGAFDQRLRSAEDVDRLGIPVVGEIPSFTGDNFGAMKDRRLSSETK